MGPILPTTAAYPSFADPYETMMAQLTMATKNLQNLQKRKESSEFQVPRSRSVKKELPKPIKKSSSKRKMTKKRLKGTPKKKRVIKPLPPRSKGWSLPLPCTPSYKVCALAGGVLLSQMPAYMKQYLHELQGSLNILEGLWHNEISLAKKCDHYVGEHSCRNVTVLRRLDSGLKNFLGDYLPNGTNGKSLFQKVEKHLNRFWQSGQRPNVDIANSCEKQLLQFRRFTEDLTALEAASPQSLPWTFLRRIDSKTACTTLKKFTPGFFLDKKSLTYALAGIAIGGALCFTLRWLSSKEKSENQKKEKNKGWGWLLF